MELLPGENRIDPGAAIDGACDGTDGIEAEREGKRSRHGNAPGGWLEAGETAEGGGDSDRAAGVRSDAYGGHSIGDRDGGSGGGASRNEGGGAVVGVLRSSEVWIETDPGVGELGHVGSTEDDGAGRFQAAHDDGIRTCGGSVSENDGAGGGGLALDVEEILDRDGNPGEWAGTRCGEGAVLPGGVGRVRASPGAFRVDVRKGSRALARGVGDGCEAGLHQIPAGDLEGAELAKDLGDGRQARGGGLGGRNGVTIDGARIKFQGVHGCLGGWVRSVDGLVRHGRSHA